MPGDQGGLAKADFFWVVGDAVVVFVHPAEEEYGRHSALGEIVMVRAIIKSVGFGLCVVAVVLAQSAVALVDVEVECVQVRADPVGAYHVNVLRIGAVFVVCAADHVDVDGQANVLQRDGGLPDPVARSFP